MKKDYLFGVRTTEDIGKYGLWKGSFISVKKESKNYYKGTYSYMGGTYSVKVPKNKCIRLDELQGI